MKYRIWEQILNEYTEFPTMMLIGEIESDSHLEAYDMAKLLHPGKVISKVDDMKTSYTFDDGITITQGRVL